MKKQISLLAIGGAVCFLIPTAIFAASVFDIQYPITELGNCGTQQECKTFCDSPDNETVCLTWAQNNGLAPKPVQRSGQQIQNQNREPIQGSDQNQNSNTSGKMERQQSKEEAFKDAPGGCKSNGECDKYCRVEEHLSECLSYSVKNGYTTQTEADKIIAQSKKGGPGGCKNQEQCNTFCRQPANARVCMQFAVDEGKITQDEAEIMIAQMEKGAMKGKKPMEVKGPGEPKLQKEKALEILKIKTGPGGCANEDTCRTYCDNADHRQECMAFAKENKLMSEQDLQKMEKLNQGGPGGCKGPEECDAFCSKEENRDMCFNFSKENGLISDEEVQMMEKQMSIVKKLEKQGGPGGCKSQEECQKFCSDQNNLETCMNFSQQQGMISPDNAEKMMGQASDFKQQIQQFQGQRQEMMMNDAQQNPTFQPGKGGNVSPPGGWKNGPPPENCPDGNCGPDSGGNLPPGKNAGGGNQPEWKYIPQQNKDGEQTKRQQPQNCPDGNCQPKEGDIQPGMNIRYEMAPGTSGGPSERYIAPGNQPIQQQKPQMMMTPQQGDGNYPKPPMGGNPDDQYRQPMMQQQPGTNFTPPQQGGESGGQTQPMPPQGTQFIPPSSQENNPPPPPISLMKIKNFLANAVSFLLGN